jgi:uncharacterized small protein (DUF1192 family)
MSTEREFTYEEYREEYLKKHRENLALKDRILELEKQNEIIRADRVNTTEQLESELGALRAEIERLKAQPSRVVDAEKLKSELVKEMYYLTASERSGIQIAFRVIDSLAIPQPDYIGALRTLAKWYADDVAPEGFESKEIAIKYFVDRALAHPTEEHVKIKKQGS